MAAQEEDAGWPQPLEGWRPASADAINSRALVHWGECAKALPSASAVTGAES